MLATLVVAAGLLGALASSPAAAKPNCLDPADCTTLASEVDSLRTAAAALKAELIQLKADIKAAPRPSPERNDLKAQARAKRKEHLAARKALRQAKQKYQKGCKRAVCRKGKGPPSN